MNKNYFIITIIFIVTILVALYLADWYNKNEEYKLSIPITEGIIPQLTLEEVDHYLLETPTTVLFICEDTTDECREVGGKLNEIVQKSTYQITFNYIDYTDNNNNFAAFKEEFNDKYALSNQLIEEAPTLIIMESGKISTVKNNVNTDEVDSFLDLKLGE